MTAEVKRRLMDKFFKECTDRTEYYPEFGDTLKVSLAPHDLFEWFCKEFAASQTPPQAAREAEPKNV